MGFYGFPVAGQVEMYGNLTYENASAAWFFMDKIYINIANVRPFVKY